MSRNDYFRFFNASLTLKSAQVIGHRLDIRSLNDVKRREVAILTVKIYLFFTSEPKQKVSRARKLNALEFTPLRITLNTQSCPELTIALESYKEKTQLELA